MNRYWMIHRLQTTGEGKTCKGYIPWKRLRRYSRHGYRDMRLTQYTTIDRSLTRSRSGLEQVRSLRWCSHFESFCTIMPANICSPFFCFEIKECKQVEREDNFCDFQLNTRAVKSIMIVHFQVLIFCQHFVQILMYVKTSICTKSVFVLGLLSVVFSHQIIY
jgi:hypothetical protein